MPMIRYECQCGNSFKKLFRVASNATLTIKCEKCGSEAKRTLSAPNSRSTMTIDNGVQPRAVEVDRDIMDLRHERAYKEPDRGD